MSILFDDSYIERKAGLTQVERQREKGNRDKGKGWLRRFEKEPGNRQAAKRIDITV